MPITNNLNKFSPNFVVQDNLTVGNTVAETTIPFGGGTLGVKVLVDNEGSSDLAGVVENRHTNTAGLGSNFVLTRTRGTSASPTTVLSGDNLGRVSSAAYDGTEFVAATEIRSDVTGTVAAGKTPGQLVLSTADNVTGALQTAMTITNAQVVNLANALPVASGGTGNTGTPTNGQLLIGNGTGYTQATITAGANITVTNGVGTISIASTGGGGGSLSWSSITANQSAAKDNGYFVTANAVQVTLPASSAVGDTFKISLDGGTSWSVRQLAGQQIFIGNQNTTAGTGGSLTSSEQGDVIELVCRQANTQWRVTSIIGNITVV
jgi:hypothetical protein